MTEIEVKEIREAIDAADNALNHLRSARKYLDSAGNWGLLDLFGGGLISGIMKHSKISDAERELDNARYALRRFSKELRDVSGYSAIHVSDFLTFADFFFDGFVADILVQSKISDGKRQCDDAIYRVEGIRAKLQNMLRGNSSSGN